MSTSGREHPQFQHWLEIIETEGVNLSKWEEDFVASMRDRFDRGWTTLTERQAEILERIYSERTP